MTLIISYIDTLFETICRHELKSAAYLVEGDKVRVWSHCCLDEYPPIKGMVWGRKSKTTAITQGQVTQNRCLHKRRKRGHTRQARRVQHEKRVYNEGKKGFTAGKRGSEGKKSKNGIHRRQNIYKEGHRQKGNTTSNRG